MKYLQTLCEQANVSLELKYYLPYLNAWEEALLKETVKKNSKLYSLSLLKAFALKILFLLQHSPFLWGELQWQLLLGKSQAMLTARGDSDHLHIALQQANEVISTASVTEAVRKKIENEAKHHGVLTEEQVRRYESIRQECITRQETLDALEDAVDNTINDIPPFTPPLSPLPRSNSTQFSHSLRPYEVKMAQARFSKENIHHQIQCEGDARLVYQTLAKELGQKPMAEKIAEDVQKVKTGLQRRSEQLEQKIEDHRRKITQQTQFAIEHRTQVMLAHAHRIESISLSLAAMIHLLQPHVKCPCLLQLMAEAQTMQESLNTNAESADLQSKLLTIHHHRDTYEKSITSVWSTLFNRQQSQHQQQLNAHLQTAITGLVIPICGFNDKNTVITPEKVKQLQKTADKLAAQQGCIAQEQVKIGQIQNISKSSP